MLPQGAFWSLMLRHARDAKGVRGSLCDQVPTPECHTPLQQDFGCLLYPERLG